MIPPSREPQEVPRGGAANNYGVLYQMLWSVLQAQKQAATCEILAAEPDETGSHLLSATLVVEPLGGGDLVHGTTVDQIKSRLSGRPWTFEDVVTQVLPDLYRAATAGRAYTVYRFITEGSCDLWKKISTEFSGLARLPALPPDLEVLDDQRPLVSPQEARVLSGPATQRRVFDHVVEVIRCKVADTAEESLEVTQFRVLQILGHFQIVDKARAGDVAAYIDEELRLRGVLDTAGTRQKLVGALLEKASSRNTPLDPVSFL